MMSENSSQAEKKTKKALDSMSQRALFMRRKWVVAISALMSLMIYPMSSLIVFISTINLNIFNTTIPVGVRLVNAFDQHLSANVIGFLATIGLGMMVAVQGFYYLFNRSMVDFYESSPHTKKERFFAIYINGLLIYAIPMFISFVLCFVSAAVMGAMVPAMIPQGIIQFIELMLLYAAVYSISTLAVMLSGNILIALFLNVMLLVLEDVVQTFIESVGSNYFATWYLGEGNMIKPVFSPVTAYISTHMPTFVENTSDFSIEVVRSHIAEALGNDIRTLLVFVICTVAAFLLYRKRPMEAAGKTFVYAPVGDAVKIICGIFASLFTALALENLTGGDVWVVFAGIMITSAVVCILIQGMMIDGNVKKKLYHIPICAAVIIGVVIVCRFDLMGFETYVPSVNSIDSCSLVCQDYNIPYFVKDRYGVYSQQYGGSYAFDNMKLKNVEDVVSLASAGQRILSEEARNYNGFSKSYLYEDDYEESSYTDSWDYVVSYNLKNGRKIFRRIRIPVGTDPELLERITTSPEYRQAIFQFDSDFEDALMAAADYHTLSYYNGCRKREIESTYVRDFIEAYKKDIFEKYAYSISVSELPMGCVQFELKDDYMGYGSKSTFYLSYPVFAEYGNTIAFLKQHNAYFEDLIPEEIVERILVTETDEDGNEKKTEYESSEEIRELLPGLFGDFIMWDWEKPGLVDYGKTVEIFTKRQVVDDEVFDGETYVMYSVNKE